MRYGVYEMKLINCSSWSAAAGITALVEKNIATERAVAIARYRVCILCHILITVLKAKIGISANKT